MSGAATSHIPGTLLDVLRGVGRVLKAHQDQTKLQCIEQLKHRLSRTHLLSGGDPGTSEPAGRGDGATLAVTRDRWKVQRRVCEVVYLCVYVRHCSTAVVQQYCCTAVLTSWFRRLPGLFGFATGGKKQTLLTKRNSGGLCASSL